MARNAPEKDIQPVLSAATDWINRCLVGDESVFYSSSLWDKDVVDELRAAFVDHPDGGKGKFLEKLKGQLADTSPRARLLMAEMLWALRLFPSNIKPSTKRKGVLDIMNFAGVQLVGEHELLADDVLRGIGSAGVSYNQGIWREVGFLIILTGILKERTSSERQTLFSSRVEHISRINSLRNEGDRQFRHMLRYFAFPDEVERIASSRARRQILDQFDVASKSEVSKWDDDRIDNALGAIRAQYEDEHPDKVLDFYHPPLVEVWKPERTDTRRSANQFTLSTVDLSKLPGYPTDSQPDAASLIQIILSNAGTHAALLFGPAGTGKTWLAGELAKKWGDTDSDRVNVVQFHPAYAYEDFMEGLRPEPDGSGHVGYRVRDGVFKEFCNRAREDSENDYLFIIDEINRGNVPKVMGELMYALEYRNSPITLPYSGDKFSIPKNVHILGTMNSSDRSVAMLDVALRRRFQFMELTPDPKLLSNVDTDDLGLAGGIGGLMEALNRRILKAQGRHKLLGHSYFMPADFKDEENAGSWTVDDFKARWFHQILPLLEEYFADDRDALRKVVGPAWEKGSRRDHDHFVPLTPDMNVKDFRAALRQLAANDDRPMTAEQAEGE